MKKTRTKILAGVVLLAAVLLITGIAYAKATKTPVTGTADVHPTGIVEREWIDDDGIWHMRGASSKLVFSGDLVGEGSSVINLNLDMLTGNGDESGHSISQLTWNGLSGTFEGSFSVTYTGGVGVGHGVYHGTGDFAGMKLMEDFNVYLLANPIFLDFNGIILDPHGG
jgi:hypothetical protein